MNFAWWERAGAKDNATIFPCSYAQRRLWFLTQLAPDSAQYNINYAFRLKGSIDLHILERCVNDLVASHDSLRTVFFDDKGVPAQAVLDERRVYIAVEDISQLPASARDEAEHDLVLRASEKIFDLANNPLLRIIAIRRGEREHTLFLSMHHIVSDYISLRVFLSQLSVLYRERLSGGTLTKFSPEIKYVDYACWESDWLKGDEARVQMAYWSHVLSGELPSFDFPFDRQRSISTNFRGALAIIPLEESIVKVLRELAYCERTSLFTVFLAAFRVLLWKYTSQNDMLIATMPAGRSHIETEKVIGFFVNTLPLRNDVDGGRTFREQLKRERQVVLDGLCAGQVPFDLIVQATNPQRTLGENPLAQVAFVLHHGASVALDLPGVSCSPIDIDNRTAKFDLTMCVFEHGADSRVFLEYNTELLDASTANRFLNHYLVLLKQVATAPDHPLEHLRVLTIAEEKEIVGGWNATGVYPTEPSCLHALVERQVDRTPDVPAISFEQTVLTYSELETQANRLAHYLLSKRMGVGGRVGLLMHRSEHLIVAMLGILKSGACYVPLDPAYPRERIAFMLSDAGISMVVASADVPEDLLRLLDEMPGVYCIYPSDWSKGDVMRPTTGVAGEDIAYVMYTSGSTGQPKGVNVPHAGISNRVLWAKRTYPLSQCDRVLQKTPFNFDVSVGEIFWPLVSGACLDVLEPALHRDPERLVDVIRRHEITACEFVPSMLQAFLNVNCAAECSSLRLVLCNGEPLPLPTARRFHELLPAAQLHNVYGPTEASVNVTAWSCAEIGRTGKILIGRPIDNTEIYILDSGLNAVPPGVVGEIYIGGRGLAQGYLNKPGLTAERFIPNPFGASGDRIYRTGDLGRFTSGGQIEILGRTDHQIKLRGFRIELGEIEIALRQDASVNAAVVIPHDFASGDTRLVAFVVPSGSEPFSVSRLRTALRGMLPEYMVPQMFVVIPEVPVTSNGKIDRKTLVALLVAQAAHFADSCDTQAPPFSPIQEKLFAIWSRILGRSDFGIRSNFFDLGGHSLLATRIVAEVRNELDADLPLSVIFTQSTVEDLARFIDKSLAKNEMEEGPTPYPGVRESAPLAFAQERLWFLQQLYPDCRAYNVAFRIDVSGEMDASRLKRAIEKVVRRQSVLCIRIVQTENGPRQEPSLGEGGVIELFPARRGERADDFFLKLASQPLGVEGTPLFKAGIWVTDERNCSIFVNAHHTVFDGASLDVFVRDLLDALKDPVDVPLPLTYFDYASWERQRAESGRVDQQMDFWMKRLSGFPINLDLPTDYPRPLVPAFAGARVPVSLSSDVMTRLAALAREEKLTLFMALFAAYAMALRVFLKSEQIIIGIPISTRRYSSLEGLVGCFANTLPIPLSLEGIESFRDGIRGVAEVLQRAYDNSDVSLEDLVAKLGVPRDLRRSPITGTIFSFEEVGDVVYSEGGLRLDVEGIYNDTAKFDLQLALMQRSGDVKGYVEFSTELFHKESIQTFVRYFLAFLEASTLHPDLATPFLNIQSLTLAKQPVRRTNSESGREDCVPLHIRFLRRAEAHPDAIALVDGQHYLTYGGLNENADKLSRRLGLLGVRAGDLVGLFLEPGAAMVTAILAVLKTGAAYMPLDPNGPAERIKHMCREAGARFVLAGDGRLSQRARETCAGLSLVEIVDVDRESEGLEAVPIEAAYSGSPDNLAYVIYTSGSTGTPKGVMLTHRNVDRLFQAAEPEFEFGADDVWALFHSYTFDFSVWEMWGALLYGGRLVVVPPLVARLPDEFRNLLHREGITILNQTPSAFRQLALATGQTSSLLPSTTRLVVFGGEALSAGVLAPWIQSEESASVQFVNMYGITETTVHVTLHRISKEDLRYSQYGVIGAPLSDLEIYLLDEYFDPVPAGAIGEIFVAGEGLARGYLNRSGLTAERFLPNPFSSRLGDRMYRTGDLGRINGENQLQYCGRGDHQVKIRGYRIELGEIEAALRQTREIQDAVVLTREAESGDLELVAYVVPAAGERCDILSLRSALKSRLPDYMLPQVFVEVSAIPTTENGKLDIEALRVGKRLQRADTKLIMTPLEEALGAVWADLLDVTVVGADSNFFELGGHSILATRLIARINQEYQAELSVRAVFENPTLRELAVKISQSLHGAVAANQRVIERHDHGRDTPASYAQEQMWFFEKLHPGTALFHVPVVLTMKGRVDVEALAEAFRILVGRHEVLRSELFLSEDDDVLVLREGEVFALPFEYLQCGCEEGRCRSFVNAWILKKFDFSAGPAWRAALYDFGENGFYLAMVFHHAFIDGWSTSILLRELMTLYSAILRSEQPVLPSLALRYGDFAAWQRRCFDDGVHHNRLMRYRDSLLGIPELQGLPPDFARPRVQSFLGDLVEFEIPHMLASRLRDLVRREGISLFMLFMAAYKTALFHRSGVDDVVVGFPAANRGNRDTEQVVGCLMNMCVLRTSVSKDMNWRTLLKRIRGGVIAAVEYQDIPFEQLVRALKPQRDLSKQPVVQVMLNFQSDTERSFKFGEASASLIDIHTGTSKCDLTLVVEDRVDTILCAVEFATDLYRRPTISGFIKHLLFVLDTASADPSLSIDELGSAQKTAAECGSAENEALVLDTSLPKAFSGRLKAAHRSRNSQHGEK